MLKANNLEAILNRPELAKGLEQYLYLRRRLYETNVSQDREFQRAFNHFYRMRQRPAAFYTAYFSYMEEHKYGCVSFEETLSYFYEQFNRMEISFSSKLISLIDPTYPVWDSIVAGDHFGIKAPYASVKDRLRKAIDRYKDYQCSYMQFLKTPEARQMIAAFCNKFPDSEISDVKKIDFILWQDR